MFVFPLYRGYMAPFDSNALPGGRITGIGDFQGLCVGGIFFCWFRKEHLKLFELGFIDFLSKDCYTGKRNS